MPRRKVSQTQPPHQSTSKKERENRRKEERAKKRATGHVEQLKPLSREAVTKICNEGGVAFSPEYARKQQEAEHQYNHIYDLVDSGQKLKKKKDAEQFIINPLCDIAENEELMPYFRILACGKLLNIYQDKRYSGRDLNKALAYAWKEEELGSIGGKVSAGEILWRIGSSEKKPEMILKALRLFHEAKMESNITAIRLLSFYYYICAQEVAADFLRNDSESVSGIKLAEKKKQKRIIVNNLIQSIIHIRDGLLKLKETNTAKIIRLVQKGVSTSTNIQSSNMIEFLERKFHEYRINSFDPQQEIIEYRIDLNEFLSKMQRILVLLKNVLEQESFKQLYQVLWDSFKLAELGNYIPDFSSLDALNSSIDLTSEEEGTPLSSLLEEVTSSASPSRDLYNQVSRQNCGMLKITDLDFRPQDIIADDESLFASDTDNFDMQILIDVYKLFDVRDIGNVAIALEGIGNVLWFSGMKHKDLFDKFKSDIQKGFSDFLDCIKKPIESPEYVLPHLCRVFLSLGRMRLSHEDEKFKEIATATIDLISQHIESLPIENCVDVIYGLSFLPHEYCCHNDVLKKLCDKLQQNTQNLSSSQIRQLSQALFIIDHDIVKNLQARKEEKREEEADNTVCRQLFKEILAIPDLVERISEHTPFLSQFMHAFEHFRLANRPMTTNWCPELFQQQAKTIREEHFQQLYFRFYRTVKRPVKKNGRPYSQFQYRMQKHVEKYLGKKTYTEGLYGPSPGDICIANKNYEAAGSPAHSLPNMLSEGEIGPEKIQRGKRFIVSDESKKLWYARHGMQLNEVELMKVVYSIPDDFESDIVDIHPAPLEVIVLPYQQIRYGQHEYHDVVRIITHAQEGESSLSLSGSQFSTFTHASGAVSGSSQLSSPSLPQQPDVNPNVGGETDISSSPQL